MGVMANDPKRFDGDVQAFSAACKALDKDYAALKSNMEALHSMYEGEAHDALMARFLSDYEALGTLVQHMKAMNSSLENARSSYEHCESRVRNAVNSMGF